MLENRGSIIFICIGTNTLVGDCLGPIVGTYLKDKFKSRLYKDIEVYGDINKPVDYNNINCILRKIENKNEESIKVLIDSALGENVGTILIGNGGIFIGEGIFKGKEIIADINIRGIVGKNYQSIKRNMNELKTVDLRKINEMANYIVKAIEI